MKNVDAKPLDLDPETISVITEEEGTAVDGGGSCLNFSCDRTKAAADLD
jgi:hypothetical protein